MIMIYITDPNDYLETGISSIVGGLRAPIACSEDIISRTEDDQSNQLFEQRNSYQASYIISNKQTSHSITF